MQDALREKLFEELGRPPAVEFLDHLRKGNLLHKGTVGDLCLPDDVGD